MRQLIHRVIGIAALMAMPSVARADHDMGAMTMTSDDGATASSFGAGVSLVAASYAQTNFGGDYEGVMPALTWMRGRWSAGATIGLYRIFANGAESYGPGDLMINGALVLYRGDALRAGLGLMMSVPTGNMEQGYGMGGPMAMPQAWAAWTRQRLTVSGSGGWGGMLSGGMAGHEGAIVGPMNQSELEWSAAVELALGRGMRAGARALGGVPVGEPGIDRVIGAVRVAWGQGRVETGAELQAGVVGDPFKVRGVVETSLHF